MSLKAIEVRHTYIFTITQVVGDSPEEGRGGQMRATLLSNRATALLKVILSSFLRSPSLISYSSIVMKMHWQI